MKPSDTISIVAAIISLGSLIVAFFSYRESSRALRISEADFKEKNLSVHAYLIDSFAFEKDNNKFCIFAISFSNNSTNPRSFPLLELEVEYYDEEGIYGKAISLPDKNITPLGLENDLKRLEAPLNLGPKETISGWIAFPLPNTSHRKFRINSYKVSGKTADGHETSVEAFLLRLIKDEEENKA